LIKNRIGDSFFFGGKDIHRLNLIPGKHEFPIHVGDSVFKYSLEQLAFLSPLALSHFIETSEPFILDFHSDASDSLVSSFTELDSLLHTTKSEFFQVDLRCSRQLPFGQDLCPCYRGKNQTFQFSSKELGRLSRKTRNSFKNFTFLVNSSKLSVNFSLFSCVSDTILQLGKSEETFEVSIPDQTLTCFISFLQIFDGLPFPWKQFPFSSVASIIRIFGLFSLYSFITDSIPLPRSLPESLDFVVREGSSMIVEAFRHSISILVMNFQVLSFDQVQSLPNHQLQDIIHSDGFHLKNEDFLLHMILNLIDQDPSRKALLKNVHFLAVSSD
jgi:hypothetical protein